MKRFLLPLAAAFLWCGAAQAQTATSGPGAAQIAMQAAAGASCPVAVAAADPADKATYAGVFGPPCSGPEIAAANAALAAFSLAAWQATQSVVITSTLFPALNGIYPVDAAAQQRITSVSTYLAVNGRFPAGQTSLAWTDTAGTPHLFTTGAEFLAFATAVADYVYAVATGGHPSNALTIP